MQVQNISGVSQRMGSVTLPAGVWTDAPLQVADTLMRRGVLRVKCQRQPLADPPEVYWMSPFSKCDGYGVVASNLLRVMRRVGVQVYPRKCWFSSENDLDEDIAPLLRLSLPRIPEIGFCLAQANHFWKLPTHYRIGYTMYESSDPLEKRGEWRHDLRYIDELVVPSTYCQEIFSWAPIPCTVIPLPLHEAFYTARLRKPKDTFTFAMHGTLTGRKSPLETIDCFQRAFPIDRFPDVRLSLKTRLGYLGWGPHQLDLPTDPRITVTDASWSRDTLVQWLHDADAYLFPSKGEGFGMPPREALATGLPTIVSDNTGLHDMVNDKFLWSVPMAGTEPCVLGGTWEIPDWDVLIDTMREVYEHRGAAYEKGQAGGTWLKTYHGSKKIGHQFCKLFGGVNPDRADRRLRRAESLEIPDAFVARVSREIQPNQSVLVVGSDAFAEALGLAAPHVSTLAVVPTTNTKYDVAVCDADIATYDVDALQALLRRVLFQVTRLICFAPSENYPELYRHDMRMLSMGDWEYLLRPFGGIVHRMGKEFVWLEVA